MCCGREFQRAGDECVKDRCPYVLVRMAGTLSSSAELERRVRNGSVISRRYDGDEPWMHLYVTSRILKMMTGNQWRLRSMGVMCCRVDERVISLAAEFWIRWSFEIWHSGWQWRRLLQKSSLWLYLYIVPKWLEPIDRANMLASCTLIGAVIFQFCFLNQPLL